MNEPKMFRVREQMILNDPPIEPGQVWVARTEEKIIRRVRVLAEYPVGLGMQTVKDYEGRLFLYEELAGGVMKTDIGRLGVFPEFNLRFVCSLEAPASDIYALEG